jgi:putative flippase GtrA
MNPLKLHLHISSLLRRIISLRFLKFGIVGGSGIWVNDRVLYLSQEYLFHASHDPAQLDRYALNVSLVLAIFFATLNNFFWNRLWTWRDRQALYHRPFLIQFGQYTVSCSISIALQFFFTNLLAPHVYYRIANLFAIAVTSVVNFLLNDIWTFGRLKIGAETKHGDGEK